MKLVTYRGADGVDRVGAVTSTLDLVVDLSGAFPDMLTLIRGGSEALTLARAAVAKRGTVLPLDQVTLRSPLPVPTSLRDFVGFELHMKQAGERVMAMRYGRLTPALRALGFGKVPDVWYQIPVYYKGNRLTVVGHDADVLWPRASTVMDYELEWAIVIGRGGKDIPRERAREHIFGYTIFNDFSARDLQGREMAAPFGPAKGKDFDTGNAIGPWIVTADEIEDPYRLAMVARVNGEEWSRGSTATMHHKFEDMIAHVSRDETLHPGEIFGSGTVGNGCGLELGRFLKSGDVVELEVERIGTLRNRVLAQPPA